MCLWMFLCVFQGLLLLVVGNALYFKRQPLYSEFRDGRTNTKRIVLDAWCDWQAEKPQGNNKE